MRRTLRICALVLASTAGTSCAEPTPSPPGEVDAFTAVAPQARVVEGRGVVRAELNAQAQRQVPEGAVDEATGRQLLTLKVGGSSPETPAMLGRYERVGAELRFTSAMPLQPDKEYLATLTLPGQETLETAFRNDASAPSAAARVVTMHPEVEAIPANILRFYVEFSAPMEGGEDFYDHVHLIDTSTGQEVDYAWREIQLWSVDRTRLTLLVHPGRVKQGITFARDMGPVLNPDRSYELVLDADIRDATGRPLAEEFRTTYRVVGRDDELPDPSAWQLTEPRPATNDALGVRFDEPMDAELLRTRLRVVDPSGEQLEGEAALAEGGDRWSFTPRDAWQQGAYHVAMSGELEDLAGNKSTEPFDKPPGWSSDTLPTLELAFRVGEAQAP